MKLDKKYGLEDKNYTNSLLDNKELNSCLPVRQKIINSYYKVSTSVAKVSQLFYQGDIYSYWKETKGKPDEETGDRRLKDIIERKHIENIRHRLEQRLKSAKARGDRQLISLLEKERQLI